MLMLVVERFDPKAAVESILDIFKVQASSHGVNIQFSIKNCLPSPVKQGERSEKEVKEILKQSDKDAETSNSDSAFPWLMGD